MPTPTYNQKYVLPSMQRFFWAQETSAAGTSPAAAAPGSVSTAATGWFIEPMRDCVIQHNRNTDEVAEYLGLPVAIVDELELTHSSDIVLTLPYRASGFAAYALASLAGDVANSGAADTIVGTTDPFTHTVVVGTKGARMNTFSLVFDTGAVSAAKGDNSLLYTYCSVTSVKLSFSPNAVLMVEIHLTSYFPGNYATAATANNTVQVVAAPSAATAVIPAVRTLSYQGQFSLFANGGATVYPSKVVQGDVTISRALEIFFSSAVNQQNPYDLLPGPIDLTANLTLLYDSIAAGTAYLDALKFNPVGSSGNVNVLKWSDSNTPGHSVEIDFWPAKWTSPPQLQKGEQSLQLSGTLRAYQDYATATGGTPAITVVKSMVFINNVGAATTPPAMIL